MDIFGKIGKALGNIAPIFPVVGAAADFISNSNTNKANMRLAQYQNSWNYDMWQKQNEYNTPLAQMERLKDAGLNPNLVYQNGADNTAGAMARAEAPTLQAYQGFSNAANNIINSMVTHAQIENMQEQNNILRIDAKAREQAIKEKELDMQRKALENKGLEEDYPWLRMYNHFNGVEMEARSRLRESDIFLNSQRIDLTEQEVKRARVLYEIEKENLRIRSHEARDYEELGLRPSDPIWVRAIANVFINMFGKGKAQELLNQLMQ